MFLVLILVALQGQNDSVSASQTVSEFIKSSCHDIAITVTRNSRASRYSCEILDREGDTLYFYRI